MKEFLSEQVIRDRVREMAAEISKDYSDHAPIFVGILNGSFIFMADLLRELTVDSEVDFFESFQLRWHRVLRYRTSA